MDFSSSVKMEKLLPLWTEFFINYTIKSQKLTYHLDLYKKLCSLKVGFVLFRLFSSSVTREREREKVGSWVVVEVASRGSSEAIRLLG